MLRFIVLALPLLILLLALFGFTVEILDLEPRNGSVVKLAVLEPPLVPEPLVLGAWLVEACGLVALFLMTQGRCGRWWLDGLVAGWLAWIFRGPLLVITIVVAVRQPQEPWWTLAFGWWVLYSVCGLTLAWLARRTELDAELEAEAATEAEAEEKEEEDVPSEAEEALEEKQSESVPETDEPPDEDPAGDEPSDQASADVETPSEVSPEVPSSAEASASEPKSPPGET